MSWLVLNERRVGGDLSQVQGDGQGEPAVAETALGKVGELAQLHGMGPVSSFL